MAQSRYRLFYDMVVRADILAKMQYTNVHMVPRVEKITVSISTSMKPTGLDNPIAAAFALELITGKTASPTRTKQNNSKYRVRPGSLEGAKVELTGDDMYHFMDRLVTQVLPRIPDFDGLNRKSFDLRGNAAFGIRDWSHFIELESQHENLSSFGPSPGLGVGIHTSAKTPDELYLLLSGLRFPFKAK